MAFIYNVYERGSKLPSVKEKFGEKYATAQLKQIRQITLRELADDVADRTSLHRADVMACLEVLPKSIASYLTNGFGVDLGSLGSMSASCRSRATSSAELFTPDMIKGARVRFTPGVELKDTIRDAGFVRGETVGPLKEKKKKSTPLDEEPTTGGGATPSPAPSSGEESTEGGY